MGSVVNAACALTVAQLTQKVQTISSSEDDEYRGFENLQRGRSGATANIHVWGDTVGNVDIAARHKWKLHNGRPTLWSAYRIIP